MKKRGKSLKTFLGQLTLIGKVMTFWVIHYIRVYKIFFTMLTPYVSKDAEFNTDSKSINLVTKFTYKKLFPENFFLNFYPKIEAQKQHVFGITF
jgi:hypothetical protein